MNTITDYEDLLARMGAKDEIAFLQFEGIMCGPIVGWLSGFGFAPDAIERELPRCLLELILLAVERRDEVHNSNFMSWCHVAVRAFLFRYWRQQAGNEPLRLSVLELHEAIAVIDGTPAAYARTARSLRISPRWLRRRHRRAIVAAHGLCASKAS